ncbi:hypothetical protein VTJ04DRAFT_5294 [Mycothermus thermophilus]|uniref:uncharacterized protein n=1 Tax=Humicola insolens TaxID=85995 RepID=UPI003742A9FB
MDPTSSDSILLTSISSSPENLDYLTPFAEEKEQEDAVHYALRNSLTTSIHNLNFLSLISHDPTILSTIDELSPDDRLRQKGANLPECLFRPLIPISEPLTISASAVSYLQQVCKSSTPADVARWTERECLAATGPLKRLTLEVPALRSDHATDCHELRRRVERFWRVGLPEHRLPFHPVDEERGEGLAFPRAWVEGDERVMREVGGEKLEVGREAMGYLMRCLKVGWTEDDWKELMEGLGTYHGIGARERLTPPLSPIREDDEPGFTPSPGTCEIPEPSEPSSRLGEDIGAAEERILAADKEFWAEALEKDHSPKRYDDLDVSEMIRAGDFRMTIELPSPKISRDMKVDVPLLPSSDEGTGLEVVRVLDSADLAKARELIISSENSSGSEGPTGQLVALFKASETTVMRQAEQEKLQPLDATARVQVPILDFSLPVPEWERRLWDEKEMFQWIQKDLDVDWQSSKWPQNRAAEQSMVWKPLTHMNERKLVTEKIEVESAILESFLRRYRDDEILTSGDYVYKEPGPAILRWPEFEDDEEVLILPDSSLNTTSSSIEDTVESPSTPSPVVSSSADQSSSPIPTPKRRVPQGGDLSILLAGRKRLIDETIEKKQQAKGLYGTGPACHDIPATGFIDDALIPSTNVLRGYMSEFTDFIPLVENFVEMNFPKKPKLSHSSYFSHRDSEPSLSKEQLDAKLMPPPPKPVLARAPEITPPETPPRIIISAAVPAVITQHLKKHLPNTVLITRDYSKHHPPGWQPGSFPPNLDEADLVISPSTGILFTTMVQLRQRALPAQRAATITPPTATPALPPFHRILCNVSLRHEHLLVLVSEGNKHSETTSPLSQSDARALAELQGFAAGLSRAAVANVEVVYVGGGQETLARWAAFFICQEQHQQHQHHQHGGVGSDGTPAVGELLLPVETSWEVFLRRAGMNGYAAQVVLGRLKVPEGTKAVGEGQDEVFGLPLFVRMGREMRVEMFEGVLGGRRVLDRVSDVVDQRWARAEVAGGLGVGVSYKGWERDRVEEKWWM